MALRRAIKISVLAHGALVLVVFMANRGFVMPKHKPSMPIQAHLVVKNKRKDLLPKKPKAPIADVGAQKKPAAPEKLDHKEAQPIGAKPAANVAKSNDNYMKALSSLTQDFAKDVAAKEDTAADPVVDGDFDDNYFDQIYSLIKASFVVPPHLNGPKGRRLKMTVRVFLAFNGDVIKIDVVTASADESFDKAVIEGIKRVESFGEVPIFLQASLRNQGVLVDLCPFTCVD